jgi:hypothetical protein
MFEQSALPLVGGASAFRFKTAPELRVTSFSLYPSISSHARARTHDVP